MLSSIPHFSCSILTRGLNSLIYGALSIESWRRSLQHAKILMFIFVCRKGGCLGGGKKTRKGYAAVERRRGPSQLAVVGSPISPRSEGGGVSDDISPEVGKGKCCICNV